MERKLQQCGTDSNGRTYPWSFVDVSSLTLARKKFVAQINFPILRRKFTLIIYDFIVFHSIFIFNLQARPSESLEDIALKFLQCKVPVVTIMNSSSEEGSIPQLLHMTSRSEILKCKLSHLLAMRINGLELMYGVNFQVYASISRTIIVLCRFFNYRLV